ncbi:MAG TPA: hypothetical protein PLI09_04600 [Candidatus Hydrogenedentes bacterium]|nr:hypothetical protein [Candidatus Hydrogenedentota bacterium]
MCLCTYIPGFFLLTAAGCAGIEGNSPSAERPHEAAVCAGNLSGRLLDNTANTNGQGSGFHPLYHAAYPESPIYRPELVGLNFEHIFNGAAADKERSMFTPRKDACVLSAQSDECASFNWPAEHSAWGMECIMNYKISAPNAVDLHFIATPTADHFPLGYAVLMWASYMNKTRERCIHFYGRDANGEGWTSFGDDLEEGFETGTVSYDGIPDLPYEKGAQTLNLIEHPTKKFLKPLYYGLLDGDQDLATQEDTLVYIMMFDHTNAIRFALWNFIQDASGKPDPHSPAWDWQYVIHTPQVGKVYDYHARVVIKPFVSREDVELEYAQWREGR